MVFHRCFLNILLLANLTLSLLYLRIYLNMKQFRVFGSMLMLKTGVTPVFKKGKSSLVQNYRPISLISVICKIFESSIKLDLVNFLAANNLITSDQHGFMSKRSTCTNLMETLNHWTLTMRDGYYTRVAYIDFARAFD